MLFGSAGALMGIGGVFWVTGAMVGAGSRAAWLLKDSMSALGAHHPGAGPTDGKSP
jgi:hypothetical protein